MSKLMASISLFLVASASWAGGTVPPPNGTIPEPATWALIGIGAAGMLLARKRK